VKSVNRREFLYCGAAMLCSAAPAYALWPFSGKEADAGDSASIRGRVFKGDAPERLWQWSREAMHYRRLADGQVVCGLCPHQCVMAPGDRSACRSRVNLDGTLYSLVYGNPCAIHIDPIEKKPLFHFKPTTKAFSIATTGCNFRCLNCQNWEISQARPHEVRHRTLMPEQVVAVARRSGCISIAYTYSEPITFFEYMWETATRARGAGLANLMISNGYINTKPLLELCRVIDAANVNLKAYSDDVYRRLNGGRLEPMLNTFKTLHDQGVHFEMTNLVVPGYVDDEEMAKRMCGWILENLGPDHPLHFSRFFPKYKLDRLAPTPVSTLTRFRELAMGEGIRYVYVGNVPGHDGSHTYCHHCGKRIIERQGYFITAYHLASDRCRFCRTKIPGVWHGPGVDPTSV
jgi:pyruvate formate lyase activating enzyme